MVHEIGVDSFHHVRHSIRRGIVNTVVPLDDLLTETEALAKKIMIYSPKTIGMIKRAVTKSQEGIPIAEGLVLEQTYSAFSYPLTEDSVLRKTWLDRTGSNPYASRDKQDT